MLRWKRLSGVVATLQPAEPVPGRARVGIADRDLVLLAEK
jgi:hypothetical protein